MYLQKKELVCLLKSEMDGKGLIFPSLSYFSASP